MPFADRSEAGRRLAEALNRFRGKDVVVLALPRGGVPVAAEVAAYLKAPLDLLLVRKIGVPTQPELAMGAVIDGDDPVIVRNDNVIRLAWVSAAEFDKSCQRELAEIERRRRLYVGDRHLVDLEGRIAIIVDDGIATGATVRAAIRGLRRRKPGSIVLAVPVAPPDTIEALRKEADDVICLEEPEFFQAIGLYYRDFRQLRDQDVIALLDSARSPVIAETPSAGKEP
ncbi:phosphoribosyltransferase [Mesorhizobium tianshanense]|uniref:Putative phosphoribosyltransferase n=1 Tax=Mesorhizobium tianshanense TaxID=39844 RepID=A0A562N7V0_9HYPH|nr:phosphoribosyltransferase [Mesorhizobium tianshanense]TWI28272.1 putative phosphoribosyltransferase [Mesorhizobium tianshanense]